MQKGEIKSWATRCQCNSWYEEEDEMLWASLFCDEGNNNKLNWFITGAPFDSHEDSVHSLRLLSSTFGSVCCGSWALKYSFWLASEMRWSLSLSPLLNGVFKRLELKSAVGYVHVRGNVISTLHTFYTQPASQYLHVRGMTGKYTACLCCCMHYICVTPAAAKNK